jgi:endonuclease/exonuclease/phosphatase family metal-dependent hydrolase
LFYRGNPQEYGIKIELRVRSRAVKKPYLGSIENHANIRIHMRLPSVLLLLSISLATMAQPMKVMTYNLRYDTPQDGVNAWPKRKDKVINLIGKEAPDVLGVQEALHHQLEDIKSGLPKYEYLGVGRDDGKQKGEYSAVFINKDKFRAVDDGTFWLSETPKVPGSKSWDAAITRVVTWVKLIGTGSTDTILMVNTHFDHIGKVAREKSAELIKERIAPLARRLPVVLTGDFNTEPTDTPYKTMTNGKVYDFRDAGKGDPAGTSCTFKVNSVPCRRIDFIFYGEGWGVQGYKVIDENDGQHYPSDHLPVVATMKRLN